ncbi:MAG: sulfite exporter TauE/SafE family protein [Chloroflexi bacterium]|nr:sulfite exporter TauE/SafE family protein [Chloroflexota bacterium]
MEAGFLAILGLGFLLGVKHATDADHVVAVSTIASDNRNIFKSSLIGIMWGTGHTLTLLLAGTAVLFFRLNIPAKFALSMEFLVGMILVALGISVLWDPIKRIHLHDHSHERRIHWHIHPQESSESHRHQHPLKPGVKPLIVGMVHGLAGSAALTLLVLTTVKSAYEGVLYLLVFGTGSIAGMLLISTAIGLPFALTAGRLGGINQTIRAGAGVLSVFLGLFIMAEIALVIGIF